MSSSTENIFAQSTVWSPRRPLVAQYGHSTLPSLLHPVPPPASLAAPAQLLESGMLQLHKHRQVRMGNIQIFLRLLQN